MRKLLGRRQPELIRELELHEIIQLGLSFEARLRDVKAQISPREFDWYPYDSFGTLSLLDRFLTGRARFPLAMIGGGPVIDIGCGDGSLSFFFESLGRQVYGLDHPPTNYNGMRGVKAMKKALHSRVTVAASDLDGHFEIPVEEAGLALFFGVLYHLKNPFQVLEQIAAHARYCLMSTVVARVAPDRRTQFGDLPVAYLTGGEGLRGDETNYWIFSEAGLRQLLDRTGWEICDWMVVQDGASPLWEGQPDERAFCLLRSRRLPPRYPTQLLDGWHKLEQSAWRWVQRRFGVAVEAAGRLTLRCTVTEPTFRELGPVALTTAYGKDVLFPSAGEYDCVYELPEAAEVYFELDKASPPDARDGRERGILVRSVEFSKV
jgi:tRNA (mo5U34)-methyltransferase